MKTFIVTRNDAGRTVLKFIETMMRDVPKNKIQRSLRNKDVKINGTRIKDPKTILKENDEIVIYGIESVTTKLRYKSIQKKFDVVYEDKNIVAVSKEKNVVTNDSPKSLDEQIWNYLKFKQTDSFIPSSIGRLDKVSTGLIVYAKNYQTLRQLKEKQGHFKKIYVFRSDLNKDITTKFRITHDEDYQREVCGDEGKKTETIFKIEKKYKTAELVTGRKHQIRSSLSKLGFPIYGDVKYGGKKANRVFLHSMSITFNNLEGDLKYLNKMEIIDFPKWNK